MKSNEVVKALEAIVRKCLGHNISKLVVCSDIDDGYVTINLGILNLVMLSINVFGLSPVFHQAHRRLIVTIQGSR